MWFLLFVIGTCSGWFHATLSLAGQVCCTFLRLLAALICPSPRECVSAVSVLQIFDELSILWLLIFALAKFTSKWQIPIRCRQCQVARSCYVRPDLTRSCVFCRGSVFRQDRQRFALVLYATGVVISFLGLVEPQFNAFWLFLFVVPVTITATRSVLFGNHGRRHGRPVFRLGLACAALWALAITVWVIDRFYCEWWSLQELPYPQFHAWWHVLVCVASYLLLVLGAFFQAFDTRPALKPFVNTWFGVPFVDFAAIPLNQ